ncbi:MAG: hypothetical protein K6A75_04025 [Ruminococcus sp.]|nr:hypothetical protein [Ruminococcus sp.]
MATFYNQATLSYNGNVTVSNITAGEILDVVSASKTPLTETYSQGADIAYAISVLNTGTTDLTGLTVTDDLGSYSFGDPASELVPLTYVEDSVKLFVNGTLQAAPTVSTADGLTFSGISVPAGGSAIIMYEAAVNQYAPFGTGASITNTAEVNGNGKAVLATASATVTPEEGAELTITKSLSPVTVSGSGELTYTFVIQNSGSAPVTETDSVIFTDVFEPALDITSVTYNGAPWAEGTNYTYDETTGQFTTTEGQITVPAAEFVQDPDTGAWSVQAGTSTIVITGNIIS